MSKRHCRDQSVCLWLGNAVLSKRQAELGCDHRYAEGLI